MTSEKINKGIISDDYGHAVEYNTQLIKITKIEGGKYDTVITIAPTKIETENIEELIRVVVEAYQYFYNKVIDEIDEKEEPNIVQVRASDDVNDYPNILENNLAEPKDYTILGVKVRYDKEMRGFVMPDHTERVMCTPTGKQEVTPELPDMEDLYQYVLDYKINMYSHDTEFLQEIEKEEN